MVQSTSHFEMKATEYKVIANRVSRYYSGSLLTASKVQPGQCSSCSLLCKKRYTHPIAVERERYTLTKH